MSLSLAGDGTVTGVTAIGDVSSTELGYLDGVTSGLQTQIDAKADASTQGLVLIDEETVTGVSSVSLNNVFTATYRNYRLLIETYGATTRADLYMRLRVSGSDATSSVYKFSYLGYRSDTGTEQAQNTGSSAITLLTANGTDTSICSYDISRPAEATTTSLVGTGMRLNDLNMIGFLSIGAAHSANTAYDGFTIFPSGGTLSARIAVYGYKGA